jgi:hypothetical protein
MGNYSQRPKKDTAEELIACMPTDILRLIISYTLSRIEMVEVVRYHIDHCDASSVIGVAVRTTDPLLYRPIPRHDTYDDEINLGAARYGVSSYFLQIQPPLDPWEPAYIFLETGLNYRGGTECCVKEVTARRLLPNHVDRDVQTWIHPCQTTWSSLAQTSPWAPQFARFWPDQSRCRLLK